MGKLAQEKIIIVKNGGDIYKEINVVVAVTIILDVWWELNDSVIRNCWIKSALVERSQMMIEETAHVSIICWMVWRRII